MRDERLGLGWMVRVNGLVPGKLLKLCTIHARLAGIMGRKDSNRIQAHGRQKVWHMPHLTE